MNVLAICAVLLSLVGAVLGGVFKAAEKAFCDPKESAQVEKAEKRQSEAERAPHVLSEGARKRPGY